MHTREANWQYVQISGPENAATELKDYIESHVDPKSGIFTLIYQIGNLKSMLQLDFLEGKIYHYGFDHRSATEPLKKALQAIFPNLNLDKHFIDISGKKRVELAQDSNASDYQIKEPPLSNPSEALDRITKFRSLLSKAKGLLQSQSIWNKTPQNVLAFHRKQPQPNLSNTFSNK
ncbi:MAG TPA: hypothetical protein VLJ15_06075 [Gammaproteobacteria bacterium]|nr:hypothetical protein [Gammaproteobacteria bacterium]